jgi:hypothetical protein
MRAKTYGVLHNVSLRCDRRGTRFVRAQIVARDRVGNTLFETEIVAYTPAGVALLLQLGNGAPVWAAGEWVDVPREGGKYSVRMLRVYDVRDSSAYTGAVANQDV